MKRIRLSRPSPALAVASLSLFVALGGVSYGVATNSIDSREIKNGTVKGKDMKNKTITAGKVKGNTLGGAAINESSLGKVPTAASADTAASAATATNANALGGSPLSALQRRVRWVQVRGSDGAILSQSGGILVERGGTGFYRVDFGDSVAGRMLLATGNETGSADTVLVNPQRCGGGAGATTCGAPDVPNVVLVHVDNPENAPLDDGDFYLAAVE